MYAWVAKATRPMRSLGRLSMNLFRTSLRHCEPVHALAVHFKILRRHAARQIEATTMSTPLAFTWVWLFVSRGCASATMNSASASQRSAARNPPERGARDIEHGAHQLHRRIDERRRLAAPALQPRQQRQQQKQQQKIGMGKRHGWICSRSLRIAFGRRGGCGTVLSPGRRFQLRLGFLHQAQRGVVQSRAIPVRRGSYLANFTRSQRWRNSPRLSFWSGSSRSVSLQFVEELFGRAFRRAELKSFLEIKTDRVRDQDAKRFRLAMSARAS